MLPAPASIAAPPSPRSRVSWNPAVPPPPVGGAPFGIGLVLGGDGDEFPSRAVDGLADGLTDGLVELVAPGLGVVVPAVPLDETAGPAEVLLVGEPAEALLVGELAEVLLVGDDVGGSAAEDE